MNPWPAKPYVCSFDKWNTASSSIHLWVQSLEQCFLYWIAWAWCLLINSIFFFFEWDCKRTYVRNILDLLLEQYCQLDWVSLFRFPCPNLVCRRQEVTEATGHQTRQRYHKPVVWQIWAFNFGFRQVARMVQCLLLRWGGLNMVSCLNSWDKYYWMIL